MASIGGEKGGPTLAQGALALAWVAVYAFQAASSEGWISGDVWRFLLYQFAFWDLRFDAALAGEGIDIQLLWSPLTYAFLHGGLLHLIMNGAIALAIGSHIERLVGSGRLLILFAAGAVAGALAFGAISHTSAPLVGASGAVFGYFGAVKRWEWRFIALYDLPQRRFWTSIAGLTIINVLLVFGYQGGAVAWEAHLGGFAAGWLIAPLLAPGRAGPSPI